MAEAEEEAEARSLPPCGGWQVSYALGA
jgi:hypothetical protein